MKSTVGRDLLVYFVKAIAGAPDSQADPHVKIEAKEVINKGFDTYSDIQLFDIVQRVGDREVDCEVSSFVHELCNLNEFYNRPKE